MNSESANIESISSIWEMQEPSTALSLSGITSHSFPCTKCGFPNALSIIPIDGICRCRVCSHKYDINEVSTIPYQRNRGGFDLMFPSPEDSMSPNRSRVMGMMMGAMVGIVAVGMIYFIIKHINRRK